MHFINWMLFKGINQKIALAFVWLNSSDFAARYRIFPAYSIFNLENAFSNCFVFCIASPLLHRVCGKCLKPFQNFLPSCSDLCVLSFNSTSESCGFILTSDWPIFLALWSKLSLYSVCVQSTNSKILFCFKLRFHITLQTVLNTSKTERSQRLFHPLLKKMHNLLQTCIFDSSSWHRLQQQWYAKHKFWPSSSVARQPLVSMATTFCGCFYILFFFPIVCSSTRLVTNVVLTACLCTIYRPVVLNCSCSL